MTFSEPVDDATLAAGDFMFSLFTTGGANAAGAGFTTGLTADDAVVVITLAAAIGVDETGDVQLTGAGVVDDALANTSTQTAARLRPRDKESF